MILDPFTERLLIRGVFWTVVGVGFWVGGVVLAHYVWERYQSD
jgi:hypothetical protein